MRVMRAVDIAGRINAFCEVHFDGENGAKAIDALSAIANDCRDKERGLNYTLNAITKHLLDNHVEMGIVRLRPGFEDWLGRKRMTEILDSPSFTCHKNIDKQCAGHMLIKGDESAFAVAARALSVDLELSGKELVFESKQACINHHAS